MHPIRIKTKDKANHLIKKKINKTITFFFLEKTQIDHPHSPALVFRKTEGKKKIKTQRNETKIEKYFLAEKKKRTKHQSQSALGH